MIILPIFQQECYKSQALSQVQSVSVDLGWRTGEGNRLESPFRWSRGEIDKATVNLVRMEIFELTEEPTVSWREGILCGEMGAGRTEAHSYSK